MVRGKYEQDSAKPCIGDRGFQRVLTYLAYAYTSMDSCLMHLDEIARGVKPNQKIYIFIAVPLPIIPNETGADCPKHEPCGEPNFSRVPSIVALSLLTSYIAIGWSGLHVLPVVILDVQGRTANITSLLGMMSPPLSASFENADQIKSMSHFDRIVPRVPGWPGLGDMLHIICGLGALHVFNSPLDTQGFLDLLLIQKQQSYARREPQSLPGFCWLGKFGWLDGPGQYPRGMRQEGQLAQRLLSTLADREHRKSPQLTNLAKLEPRRESMLKQALETWSWNAQQFDSDELVYAALFMLQSVLLSNDLASFTVPQETLQALVLDCRAAYNEDVRYHNFRHAIDVMQSIFFFMAETKLISGLAPSVAPERRAMDASGLMPRHALVLLVAALGHDVGHPGVNNAFLDRTHAPLATLFGERSILESFHCAVYLGILKRHWPTLMNDYDICDGIARAILATDMAFHQDYISESRRLFSRDDRCSAQSSLIDHKMRLQCALYLKCADISNVVGWQAYANGVANPCQARPFDIAESWARTLRLEFNSQGQFEHSLKIPTALFGGPPRLEDDKQLAVSQVGFIQHFALPLFELMSDISSDMAFAHQEIFKNLEKWASRTIQSAGQNG